MLTVLFDLDTLAAGSGPPKLITIMWRPCIPSWRPFSPPVLITDQSPTHAHTHTHTHTQTGSLTHSHTHSLSLSHTHTRTKPTPPCHSITLHKSVASGRQPLKALLRTSSPSFLDVVLASPGPCSPPSSLIPPPLAHPLTKKARDGGCLDAYRQKGGPMKFTD